MKKKAYGLVGRNINYSFSAGYFKDKFSNEGLKKTAYHNYDIEAISQLSQIVKSTKQLKGFNVTIPYKEEIIPQLDKLSKKAKKIGAVNTVTVSKKGKLKGFNTDYYGFKKSLIPLLQPHHTKALILGTGGASKAVAFALQKLKISYNFVSRTPADGSCTYNLLTGEIFKEYTIVINTTPLGTFPDIDTCPPLDYSLFTDKHIAFDLVYNPAETTFLKQAGQQGATTQNGYDMLVYQAEKSWKIWNS